MPHINPVELANRFQSPGGDDWAAFMDRLLAAACWESGIPASELRTNLRTDIKDGGVDSRVSKGSLQDISGYLSDLSIWQYKAAHEANLSDTKLVAEVMKPFAKERIQQGDAYRLCLAIQSADMRRTKLEKQLARKIATFHKNGPAPRVLTADDAARLASHFPNFLHDYRGLEFQSRTLTFTAWGKSITARTPTFVPSKPFLELETHLRAFTNPSAIPSEPIFIVHGQAAVGKTRAVYESLRSVEAASALVVYTADAKQALDFAYILANNNEISAILVIDEISIETRHRLRETLEGHKHRIRTIGIKHDTEPGDFELDSSQVFHFEQQSVEEVLTANFAAIPNDRLRAYLHLAEGYLRFAIDLCRNDAHIGIAQGNVLPTLQEVTNYYRRTLGGDQVYLDALSLFSRVGRDEDVSGELDKLCEWCGLDRRQFEERCNELKDAPGFVERSAIYYRVRPALIARHAFASAWKKWVEVKEEKFFGWVASLPWEMQESFLVRVQSSAGENERISVRSFYQKEVSRLRPSDLKDQQKVSRLTSIVEIDPEHYPRCPAAELL